MSGADLFVDGFPHGTPAGFDRGCKGGACPNAAAVGLMLCREAKVRYAGDLGYRRAVDAGKAPLTREAFSDRVQAKARPQRVTTTTVAVEEPVLPTSTFDREAVAVRGARKEVAAIYSRPIRAEGDAVQIKHGTEGGYKKGCRKKDSERCPAKLAGGKSCYEVNAKIQADYAAKRKARMAGEVAAPKPAPAVIPAPVPVAIPEEVWAAVNGAVVSVVSDEADYLVPDELSRLLKENADLKERVVLLEMELDVAKSQVRSSGSVEVGAIRLPAQVLMSVPGWGRVELRLGDAS